jgi:hypothetical protein
MAMYASAETITLRFCAFHGAVIIHFLVYYISIYALTIQHYCGCSKTSPKGVRHRSQIRLFVCSRSRSIYSQQVCVHWLSLTFSELFRCGFFIVLVVCSAIIQIRFGRNLWTISCRHRVRIELQTYLDKRATCWRVRRPVSKRQKPNPWRLSFEMCLCCASMLFKLKERIVTSKMCSFNVDSPEWWWYYRLFCVDIVEILLPIVTWMQSPANPSEHNIRSICMINSMRCIALNGQCGQTCVLLSDASILLLFVLYWLLEIKYVEHTWREASGRARVQQLTAPNPLLRFFVRVQRAKNFWLLASLQPGLLHFSMGTPISV